MTWASRPNYEAALIIGISIYVGLALGRAAYICEAAGVILLSIAAFGLKNLDQAGVLLGVMALPLVHASCLTAQKMKPEVNYYLYDVGLDVQSRVGFWSAVTFGSAFLADMCTRRSSYTNQPSSGPSQH
eukprot:CAMPEP_0114313738 /NCGR_PEP_ID=MMETSP0059-20121206/21319_1 /TAXON_ID=36894 /ORGANISM="Pyramimonas parkeae, Strain CCMP726" /LENGTH=128 /DNA_ID=CAMNT_0001438601 /DNA_START=125 /DNA_END=508 /DNA_ORIENTATION=+